MIARYSRLILPAILMTATCAFSACAGGNLSTPSVQGLNQAASAAHDGGEIGAAILNPQPNVSCPSKFYACVTVSQKRGLSLYWCFGPKSDPCSNSDVSKRKWSGLVCAAAGTTCKAPIKQLTAKWSGPFRCGGKFNCNGTYELDKLTPGPGLKQTNQYVYKQDVHICAGKKCQIDLIGLNVGP
ncbi:MAG TPA: hypothetical protein VIX60_07460 [Candidatus Cybelea sp.]